MYFTSSRKTSPQFLSSEERMKLQGNVAPFSFEEKGFRIEVLSEIIYFNMYHDRLIHTDCERSFSFSESLETNIGSSSNHYCFISLNILKIYWR